MDRTAARIPFALKVACTLFATATFAAYAAYYSFAHTFLWFSSLALLITCVALWLESPLLASMQAVSVVLLELGYTLDFLIRLTTGVFVLGLSVYFFQAEDSPWWVRGFSLFHLPLPWLLLWMLRRLGYDRRALWLQSCVAWGLLPLCYFFTDPADNVNWVFGPKDPRWRFLPPWGWLTMLMLAIPAMLYLPSHWILSRLFPAPLRPETVHTSERTVMRNA